MIIRIEMRPFRGREEWYAVCDDLYDGADQRPLAGMGATEDEAVADLWLALENLLCPECQSGPGEPHSIHCSLEHGELAYRSDP